MSRSLSLLVPCAFVAAFVTFGCEPADPDDGNDGDASCAEVCGVLMASECFYGGGEADCNTSCEGWDSQAAASSLIGCPEAWIDYKECMAAASVDNCGGVATWNVIECRGEWDHYQNYCVYGFSSTQPCLGGATWDAYCTGVAGKPHGKLCRGEEEAGCVVGGTPINTDLYCCP